MYTQAQKPLITIRCGKHNVIACGMYDAELKKLLHACKFDGLREATQPLAMLLAARLQPHTGEHHAVTHIPTAPQHVRHRGFDHMAIIAKLVATELSLLHRPTLFRLRSDRQIGATRLQRIAQAPQQLGVFPSAVVGARLIVIDDVMTTGATMNAALSQLEGHKASKLLCATIAYDE